jgi:predicted protein tyrosine phosphatase
MKILFVCSVNKHRSKTAEDYFGDKYEKTNHVFASAGTNIKTCMKEGTNPLDSWLLEWADKIYVMESKHKQEIMSGGSSYTNKIEVLGIPDNFKYNQPELIELLESKIKI